MKDAALRPAGTVQPEAERLRKRIAEWAADCLDVLRKAEPQLPDELNDRPTGRVRAFVGYRGSRGVVTGHSGYRFAFAHLCGGLAGAAGTPL